MPDLWLLPRPLVLASKSQARRALLAASGIPFEAIEADVDERGMFEIRTKSKWDKLHPNLVPSQTGRDEHILNNHPPMKNNKNFHLAHTNSA